MQWPSLEVEVVEGDTGGGWTSGQVKRWETKWPRSLAVGEVGARGMRAVYAPESVDMCISEKEGAGGRRTVECT
jgi:hypothetical protein